MSDVFSTDGIIEPIDLTDVRAFLSMAETDTTQDVLLSTLITNCRASMEQYLPFFVAPRPMVSLVIDTPIVDLRGPVESLTSVTTEAGVDITASCTLEGHVLTIPPTVGRVRVEYVTGAYVPAPVQTALLVMVRNLYVDRTADPITPEVLHILNDLVEVNV